MNQTWTEIRQIGDTWRRFANHVANWQEPLTALTETRKLKNHVAEGFRTINRRQGGTWKLFDIVMERFNRLKGIL